LSTHITSFVNITCAGSGILEMGLCSWYEHERCTR
jgi:hypothetical protein